jgi:crotonobetainyl-CoA:carnitine CoA-transferase CaiB-like acyl-CoA transferase
LINAGIPAGPIYSVDQVFNDPHVQSQGFIEKVKHRTIGDLRLATNPIKREGGWRKEGNMAPPVLGEHTIEILEDYGFVKGRIEDLLNRKIIHSFKGAT